MFEEWYLFFDKKSLLQKCSVRRHIVIIQSPLPGQRCGLYQ